MTSSQFAIMQQLSLSQYALISVQSHEDCHSNSNHPSKCFHVCSTSECERIPAVHNPRVSGPVPEIVGQLWHLRLEAFTQHPQEFAILVMAPWQDGLQTEELKLNSHSLSIDVSKMSVVVPKLIILPLQYIHHSIGCQQQCCKCQHRLLRYCSIVQCQTTAKFGPATCTDMQPAQAQFG